MRTSVLFFLILSLLCSSRILAKESKYQNPDDPEAIKASEDAVGALGPNHGAISIGSVQLQIISNSVGLVGLPSSTGGSGLALKKDIRDAERTLVDLGATKSAVGYELSLSGDVLFDFDKWDIKPQAESILSELADALKKFGKKNVSIAGHTDGIGSDSYNLELSRKRADSVRYWLVSKGNVKEASFSVRGMGKSMPLAPNTHPDGSDNPMGRAKNRRVEIGIN